MGDVDAIMKEALEMAANPTLAALTNARQLTKPKAPEKRRSGQRAKLTDVEAMACAAYVSDLCARFEVNFADACREVLKDEPNNYDKYRLSRREAEAHSDGRALESRRFSKSVGRFADIVEAIRDAAEADGKVPEGLLEGLADCIPDFLAPYRLESPPLDEELAYALALMGPWASRTRHKGGTRICLPELFRWAERNDLGYSAHKGEFVSRNTDDPYDYAIEFGVAPRVALALRRVAVGTMAASRADEDLGPVQALFMEAIQLALRPVGDEVKPVLIAEPFTILKGEPGDRRTHVQRGPIRILSGTPFTAHNVPDTDWTVAGSRDMKITCSAFQAHGQEILMRAEELGHPEIWDGEIQLPRAIEPTSQALAAWADTRDDNWRVMFRWDKRKLPFPTAFALPIMADLPGGGDDVSFLKRFRQALYDETISNMLIGECVKRMKAKEQFESKSARDEAASLAAFRLAMSR